MSTKCPVCGAPLKNGNCEYCGHTETSANNMAAGNQYQQPQIVINNNNVVQNGAGYVRMASSKSKMVALLLCIFLGFFGGHRFYVGKIGSGILYCFTGGMFGIGWIVDLISILLGSFKDSYGLPLK